MAKKQIFLASSAELKEDRIQFEIFINRKNKEWHHKGVFLDLIVWEDFLDAMSQTRLQDEYNKAIQESDIFVLLFFTKVGQYTEEEFETAFGQFKSTNKPLIFTYFKNAQISTGSINKDMLTLLSFKERLDQLGHFYTTYKSIEDLQLKFNQQLERLVASEFKKPDKHFDEKEKGSPKLSKELTLNIPRTHPDDIVGREEDVTQLHELLASDKRVVVVNGLGGIGKTTLVQVYVSRYYDEYEHIAWITQSSNSIAGDFINTAGLIDNLQVNTAGAEPQQIFEDIIRKLKSIESRPNLLIIDNAEQSIRQCRDMLPTQPQWHLLATSREELAGFCLKPLDFLSEYQAIKLFRKHYTLHKLLQQDIQELMRVVDYHTLTIEVLAKTAQVQRYDVHTLKEAIERDVRAGVEVSRHGGQVDKVGTYLSTVFNMSRMREAGIWLMKQLACLPPEFHTYDLLQELIIDEASAYKDTFSETLAEVTKKGWCLQNKETDSYKMHRIVAEVVKKQHAFSIKDVKSLIDAINKKLRIDQAKDNPVDKFIWIPYGKALLSNFNDDTNSEIVLLQNNLALVLQDLGDYQGAKALLEKAVLFDEKNYGTEHPDTATSYSNLAMVLRYLGDYQEAKALLEKAVLSDEKNFGTEHPTTAIRYSNLALVLRDLGNYEAAKALLEKAVPSDEKNFGTEHPATARRYSNLALVLQNLGDYEAAKALLEKAVLSDEKNFGTEHPATAIRYSNLATVLRDLGDYQGAKALLEKTVLSAEKNYGTEHPTTTTSYSNLALVLQDLGDYQGAKALLEKTVLSDEKKFGTEHPSTALNYYNLALVLKDLGDYQGAFELSAKALAILQHTLPEGHPNIKIVNNIYQSIKCKIA